MGKKGASSIVGTIIAVVIAILFIIVMVGFVKNVFAALPTIRGAIPDTGLVACFGEGNSIHCLKKDTGQEIFYFTSPERGWKFRSAEASPYLKKDRLYFAIGSRMCFEDTRGIWKCQDACKKLDMPVVVSDDKIASGYSGNLVWSYISELDSESSIDCARTIDNVFSYPATDGKDIFYVSGDIGKYYLKSLSNKNLKIEEPTSNLVYDSKNKRICSTTASYIFCADDNLYDWYQLRSGKYTKLEANDGTIYAVKETDNGNYMYDTSTDDSLIWEGGNQTPDIIGFAVGKNNNDKVICYTHYNDNAGWFSCGFFSSDIGFKFFQVKTPAYWDYQKPTKPTIEGDVAYVGLGDKVCAYNTTLMDGKSYIAGNVKKNIEEGKSPEIWCTDFDSQISTGIAVLQDWEKSNE